MLILRSRTMPLLWVAVGIALMLVLMLVVKLDAFFALLLTSLAVALLNGLDLLAALQSILKGVGATMGSVALILVFGAMLGRLLEESGAAQAIATRLIEMTGVKHVQFAMAITGMLVGIAMHYNAGFLVLIPIVYTVAITTGLPLVYIGLPLASALSVTHGFTPPHPAPTFLALLYHADVNRTLLVGLVAAVPACLLGGVVFSRFVKVRALTPPEGLARAKPLARDQLPPMGTSLTAALAPVILMLANAVVDITAGTSAIDPSKPEYHAQLAAAVSNPALRALVSSLKFLGNPTVALMIAVLVALYTLGIRRGRTMESLMKTLQGAVGTIAGIILIIAAGGAFSQVLRDGGVSDYITRQAAGIHVNPLVLAFGVAALLRGAIGSATVAGMTAAGVLAPTALGSNVHPELMVLATGAGSLMFSHFNDSGFWMFKEYFNATVRETFLTWSMMELIVGVVGLAMALLMNLVW
ncbi:MAG TPA: gluconate:H+ symporter [Gemmatimonadaceae bacterium]|nr:gluconate:H+ symporter [Gemmatimonadaceae bacterium]